MTSSPYFADRKGKSFGCTIALMLSKLCTESRSFNGLEVIISYVLYACFSFLNLKFFLSFNENTYICRHGFYIFLPF